MSRLFRLFVLPAAGGALLGVAAASAFDSAAPLAQATAPAIVLTQLDGTAPQPPRRPRVIEELPVPRLNDRVPQRRQRADEDQRPGQRGSARPGQEQTAKEPAAKPKSREEALNDLHQRLTKAKDVNEARGIVRAIEELWKVSGSDTADLLMSRAQSAVQKKNMRLATRLFDKIVDVHPEWAEGWNQRATVRFRENDVEGAVADIGKVLTIEPRHFRALTGLGFIMKREGYDKQALQAFRKALEINPQQERIKKEVETLTISVEGRGI